MKYKEVEEWVENLKKWEKWAKSLSDEELFVLLPLLHEEALRRAKAR